MGWKTKVKAGLGFRSAAIVCEKPWVPFPAQEKEKVKAKAATTVLFEAGWYL